MPNKPVCIDGLKIFIVEDLERTGMLAAFTTRTGGLSQKPFDSLNLGLRSDDNPQIVVRNRRLVAKALGFDTERMTFAEQVHGSNVARVNENLAGAGLSEVSSAVAQTDAMITGLTGVSLVILTADCLPIILFDPKTRLVAAAHAGWRGTLYKIAARVVESMVDLGTNPADIEACFGPSIGECCYEVGVDLYKRFSQQFSLPARQSHPRLNLGKLNESVLLNLGLKVERIQRMELCTACHPELFYSWRRDGVVTGRQAAIVMSAPVGTKKRRAAMAKETS